MVKNQKKEKTTRLTEIGAGRLFASRCFTCSVMWRSKGLISMVWKGSRVGAYNFCLPKLSMFSSKVHQYSNTYKWNDNQKKVSFLPFCCFNVIYYITAFSPKYFLGCFWYYINMFYGHLFKDWKLDITLLLFMNYCFNILKS